MSVIEFRGDGVEAMIATRKFIQTVRFVLAGAVVMYGFAVFRLPSSAKPNPSMLRALSVLAVSMAILLFSNAENSGLTR